MPFPDTPRSIFDKNPLTEVICQLTFPPILEIAAEEPASFQKRIRDRYPLYEKLAEGPSLGGLPKEVAEVVGSLSVFPKRQALHRFMAEDGQTEIRITSGFVSISTTAYRRWEDFRKEIDLAREATEQCYAPAFYTRIGLRYEDAIVPDELGMANEEWHQFLRPAIAGILGEAEVMDEVESCKTEAKLRVSDVEDGFVRVVYGTAIEEDSGRRAFLVDADFFTERRSGATDVAEVLNRFNRHAGNLFRWFASDRLKHTLGSGTFDVS